MGSVGAATRVPSFWDILQSGRLRNLNYQPQRRIDCYETSNHRKPSECVRQLAIPPESAIRDLNARRQHVARTPNLEFPAADDTLLRQLMQVRGYTYHRSPVRVGWFSPTDGPQQLKIVAGALGLALPHPAAMAAA